MAKPKLLLVLKDVKLKRKVLELAPLQLYKLSEASGGDWIDTLKEASIDVAIVQVDTFDSEDLRLLSDSNLLTDIDVIFISEGEPNPYIDKAMMRGVSYHLRSPVDFEFLSDLLSDLQIELAETSVDTEQVMTSELDQFGLLIGSSKVMRKLYRLIRKSADSEASIFVVGESGSGKELVANTVHLMSARSDKAFVSVNCGAISPELIESELFGHVKGAFTGASTDRIGVFEQADGGTLFLDEVTEMPLDHQVKLLRVLETGEYKKVGSDKLQTCDVRIVAATNRDPSEAVQSELFREDLYFRLAQITVPVPALRERGDDVLGLARHFLAHRNAEENAELEISVDALERIKKHDWPGNVRELKHAVERAFILADDAITLEHIIIEAPLLPTQEAPVPTDMTLEEVEKTVINATLEDLEGNKTETASKLGISVKTLYNKLEKYSDAEE